MGWLCGVGVFGQSVLTLSRPCTSDSKINQSRDETPRLRGGRVDDFSFSIVKAHFLFEFRCTFSISCNIDIVFWFYIDRPFGLPSFMSALPIYRMQ